jgi:CheY-like chemotaxis protein
VVLDEVSAYARPVQLEIAGPEVTLATDAVQPLSLALHELATNALKHGALSAEAGLVRVTWRAQDDRLELTWVETGGPAVAKPERLGFGSKLLQKTVDRQLEGVLRLEWAREGLTATISLPAASFTLDGHSGDATAREDASRFPALDGQNRCVLVVEDEELVAMDLCAELEQLGWQVLGPAATVAQAEAVLRDSPPVDVAVLDVNLRGRPVYPLAEALLERRVPFLFCTGYEIVDPGGRFQTAPVVRKPAHRGAIATALQRLLAAPTPRALNQ